MKKNDVGLCAREMYAQFLYRIYLIKQKNPNISICLFCRPTFLSNKSFKKFRKFLLLEFQYVNGFISDSSLFGGTGSWALSFNIWKPGKTQNIDSFVHDVIDFTDESHWFNPFYQDKNDIVVIWSDLPDDEVENN